MVSILRKNIIEILSIFFLIYVIIKSTIYYKRKEFISGEKIYYGDEARNISLIFLIPSVIILTRVS